MATTTNYAWETPDDTDLVKDGASAIRTLGSSIDTTTKALNPSTTLGDIEYRSATANTNTRLGIGTSGQVLTVNGSGVPAWSTLSAGAFTQISSQTLSGSSVSFSSIAGTYKHLFFIVRNPVTTGGSYYPIKFYANSDTTSTRYRQGGFYSNHTGGTSAFVRGAGGSTSYWGDIFSQFSSASTITYAGWLYDYADSTAPQIGTLMCAGVSGGDTYDFSSQIRYSENAAITTFTVETTGTFNGGTAILYGVN